MRHRLHALCPYFAMFPEAFVESWLAKLTKPNDTVLDLFAGRGTAPFQALLMERNAVAIDVSPVAYCITRAKTNAPPASAVRRRLTQLERMFEPRDWENSRRALPVFFHFAYQPRTLQQVLFLRQSLRWRTSDVDCMIAALVLGALHGESQSSPSYLSNQMPHAIATKPAYSVRFWQSRRLVAPARDTFELLRTKVTYRYETGLPAGRASVHLGDMRSLPQLIKSHSQRITCAITSPPYLDVTNFEEDQWLRNWFLEGPPHPTTTRLTLDNRHGSADSYWNLIADMWRVFGYIMAPKSNIVIRFGAKRIGPTQMIRTLDASSTFAGRKVRLVSHSVSEIKNRQTETFRPGSKGCLFEVDCHFAMT